MDRKTIFRCVVASLIFAIVASVASTTFVSAPASGETVIDMSLMDSEAMEAMSIEEAHRYIASQPTKQVTGLERIFYSFSHPQVWRFYLRALSTWFAVLFLATLSVSYWNGRAFNKSLKGDDASGAL